MHNFKELKVWQDAMKLAGEIYQLTKGFPQEEKFGLTSQVIRSAISIPSNIAEGCGRGTDKDFVRFLSISLGSSYELETQLILAHSFKILSIENLNSTTEKLKQIQKMLNGLINKYK